MVSEYPGLCGHSVRGSPGLRGHGVVHSSPGLCRQGLLKQAVHLDGLSFTSRSNQDRLIRPVNTSG